MNKAEESRRSCFGYGYEHGCSLHGCAVIQKAIAQLKELTKEDAQ